MTASESTTDTSVATGAGAGAAPTSRAAGVPDAADIAGFVRRIAREDPTRAAVVEVRRRRGRRLTSTVTTYQELSERADRLAVGLRRIGIREGTRCSFMVPPGADAVALGIALFSVGATLVGIEPVSHGLRRVTRCLDRVAPEVFLGTPRAHLARLLFGWGRGSIRTTVVAGRAGPLGAHRLADLELEDGDARPAAVDLDDPAIVAFTTGSTGMPKPTEMSWRNFAALLELFREHWDVGDAEVVDLVTFPMFWMIAIAKGGTTVIPPMDFTLRGPADADPEALLDTIAEHEVTSMFGSPALLRNLAAHARATGRTAGLRRIVAGGAEVHADVFAGVDRLLAPAGAIHTDYGATEALPLTEMDGPTILSETWPQTERGAGVCVGRPVPRSEVRVIEPVDGPIASIDEVTELPSGAIGEVIGRGPHVSVRYLDAPDDTAANKVPDPTGTWHRPGDTGYLDDQGRLWVCGRVSHLVVTPERTYHPLRCEPVASSHPDVHRAALVGVTDRHGRVTATLCVEPAATGRDHERLRAEVRQLLAEHEATRGIREVTIVDPLPVDKRHNAKIDRPALGAKLSGDRS